MEKVQWISIDKKQNGLKYSKNDKSSTLPRPIDDACPERTYWRVACALNSCWWEQAWNKTKKDRRWKPKKNTEWSKADKKHCPKGPIRSSGLATLIIFRHFDV